MGLGNAARNAEAKPCSPTCCAGNLNKSLKYAFAVLGRYAAAGIANRKQQLAVLLPCTKAHFAARLGMADSIVGQVYKHTHNLPGIHRDLWQRGLCLSYEPDALLVGLVLHCRCSRFHHVGGLCGLPAQGGNPRLQPRELQQILHHALQIYHPEWNSFACLDQDNARKSRRAAIEHCAGTGALLMPCHFGAPFHCHIDHKGSGFAPRFAANF